MTHDRPQLVSIVVPLLNEEANLPTLIDRINDATAELFYEFEIILVDDGSTDRSAELIAEFSSQDPRVRGLSLSRNFGTQMAIFAGLEHARGDAVIVMDADLQHPPSLLPQLLERWQDGYEVVYTVRENQYEPSRFRRIMSAAFARLFGKLVDTHVDPGASDFRLLDRIVVDHLVQMRERKRFFRYLVTWVGFRQIGIPYVVGDRHAGTTKYSLKKLILLAIDAITSFSALPLRLCTFAGLLISVCCAVYALWAIYERLFTDRYVPGWPALIVAVLFLGSVQLVSLGILGEYVGRIYDEVKGRPLYIARKKIGFGGMRSRTTEHRSVTGNDDLSHRAPDATHEPLTSEA